MFKLNSEVSVIKIDGTALAWLVPRPRKFLHNGSDVTLTETTGSFLEAAHESTGRDR